MDLDAFYVVDYNELPLEICRLSGLCQDREGIDKVIEQAVRLFCGVTQTVLFHWPGADVPEFGDVLHENDEFIVIRKECFDRPLDL